MKYVLKKRQAMIHDDEQDGELAEEAKSMNTYTHPLKARK
jgi:hypothetical protein